MKKLFFAICISLVIASCQSNPTKKYPIIKLDDYHSFIKPDTASDTTQHDYLIAPTNGFIIDSKGYDFSAIRKVNEGKLPDAVFLLSKTGKYKVKFNPGELTLIDKNSLNSIDIDSGSFKGFIKGDSFMMSIGTTKLEDTSYVMKTYWLSMLNIE